MNYPLDTVKNFEQRNFTCRLVVVSAKIHLKNKLPCLVLYNGIGSLIYVEKNYLNNYFLVKYFTNTVQMIHKYSTTHRIVLLLVKDK